MIELNGLLPDTNVQIKNIGTRLGDCLGEKPARPLFNLVPANHANVSQFFSQSGRLARVPPALRLFGRTRHGATLPIRPDGSCCAPRGLIMPLVSRLCAGFFPTS